MRELGAINFSTVYLEGKAHDWWYHGMSTLGHNPITSYLEFTQRLIDRFDQGDPKIHFRELTQLKKTGSPESYIEEFQRIAMMVPDISPARLLMEGCWNSYVVGLRLLIPPTYRMPYGGLGT
jgi:hypothetical protein